MSRVGSWERINEITRDNKDGLRIREAIFDCMAAIWRPSLGHLVPETPRMMESVEA